MTDINATYDLAQAVLDGIAAHWPADAEPLPGRSFVSFSTPVWDCGQITAFIERTYTTESDLAFEVIVNEQTSVGFAMSAAVLSIAILRCVPTIDDNGTPPTPAEHEDAASIILRDERGLRAAILSAYHAGELGGCNGLALEAWAAQSDQGGVAGGQIRIRVLL